MKLYSYLVCFVLLCASYSTTAQSVYKQVTYKDALRPALVLPLMYKTDITEQTILKKLKETGYKPETKGNMFRKSNKQDGFYVFPGVTLPELNNQKLDLYFKVDPMSGDSSYNSAITLLVSKGYDNFVAPEVDSATFSASQHFLNGFVTETADFNLNDQIQKQKQKIAESEKKWEDLRKQHDDANRKVSDLQATVKNLEDQQRVQQQEVDSQRAALQALEARRKP